MTRLLQLFDLVLLGVSVMVPVAGATVVGLVRWRQGRGLRAGPAWSRSVAEVAMVAGTLPWLIMALWPIDLPADTVRWHLLPLTDIAAQLRGSPGEAFAQIVANLLIFFTLGVFAPVRFRRFADSARLLALGLAGSLLLEISQQVFGTGRVFSVDDVLLNGLGCFLGGLVSRRWWRKPAGAAVPIG